MKTIKVPESLHRLLKIRAAELGKGLQGVTEEALRRGLEAMMLDALKNMADEQQEDRHKAL